MSCSLSINLILSSHHYFTVNSTSHYSKQNHMFSNPMTLQHIPALRALSFNFCSLHFGLCSFCFFLSWIIHVLLNVSAGLLSYLSYFSTSLLTMFFYSLRKKNNSLQTVISYLPFLVSVFPIHSSIYCRLV